LEGAMTNAATGAGAAGTATTGAGLAGSGVAGAAAGAPAAGTAGATAIGAIVGVCAVAIDATHHVIATRIVAAARTVFIVPPASAQLPDHANSIAMFATIKSRIETAMVAIFSAIASHRYLSGICFNALNGW